MIRMIRMIRNKSTQTVSMPDPPRPNAPMWKPLTRLCCMGSLDWFSPASPVPLLLKPCSWVNMRASVACGHAHKKAYLAGFHACRSNDGQHGHRACWDMGVSGQFRAYHVSQGQRCSRDIRKYVWCKHFKYWAISHWQAVGTPNCWQAWG